MWVWHNADLYSFGFSLFDVVKELVFCFLGLCYL